METKTKLNGTPAKGETGKPADTKNGAENTTVLRKITPAYPIADKLAGIHKAHTLSKKRDSLMATQDQLRDFEADLSEEDSISLESRKHRDIKVQRPDIVKRFLEILKSEVETQIKQINAEILNVAV